MTSMQHALKALFADMLSTIVFLALFAITGSVLLTTAIAIGVGIVQIAVEKWRGRPVEIMQWLSMGLVLVFGGASLLTHDDRFIMIKPTLIYAAVGTVMLRPGWQGRYLPEIVHAHVPEGVLVGCGYAWAAMMFAIALGNAAIVTFADRPAWVLYNSVVPLAGKFGLFGMQYLVFRTFIRGRLKRQAAA
jgi:intracellular septation protein A